MEYKFSLKVYDRRIKDIKTGQFKPTSGAQVVLIANYLKPFIGKKVDGVIFLPDEVSK
jgi:hypothetical protein